jgi:hypothetical protein
VILTKNKLIVTIHQPDFLPWLGFFNKINKADIWVVLNHTLNNPRDSAFWGRRVKILANGQPYWLSLPLEKPYQKGLIGIPICEMRYKISDIRAFKNGLVTINNSYKKAPFFEDVFPIIKNYYESEEPLLENRNMSFIKTIMERMKIKTKIVYSSSLNCVESSTSLLIEIIFKVGGTSYICGGGASNYQNDELFKKNCIELTYNNFMHPTYPQFNSRQFQHGLSIVDCLMNIGFEETRKILS